jgi:hypothetical protein
MISSAAEPFAALRSAAVDGLEDRVHSFFRRECIHLNRNVSRSIEG